MVRYFHTWYAPNNMAIVLAGDITAAEALPVLEKIFKDFKPKKVPELTEFDLRGPHGRVERTLQAEGENSVHLGWRTVDANHPDRPAIEVMDLLMDNERAGLINLDLVLSQKLPKAGSRPDFLREGGVWTMTGVARDGQSLDEIEALLLGLVQKLKNGEFSAADMAAAVTNEEIQEKLALESNENRTMPIATAFGSRTPWPTVAHRLEVMRKVTREDAIRVARTYLGDDRVVVKRIRGESRRPEWSPRTSHRFGLMPTGRASGPAKFW